MLSHTWNNKPARNAVQGCFWKLWGPEAGGSTKQAFGVWQDVLLYGDMMEGEKKKKEEKLSKRYQRDKFRNVLHVTADHEA